MTNLLFSDVPLDDVDFMKNAKRWRITSLVFCLVFAIFGGVCLASENTFGENIYLILIVPMAGIALFVCIFISTYCQSRQFLLVFDSAIKYKKRIFGKEKQLLIAPNDYRIKLKRFTHRGGYTVWLLFLNQKNKRLLSYKLSQSLTNKQKESLCNIGCKIVDSQKVLNKIN